MKYFYTNIWQYLSHIANSPQMRERHEQKYKEVWLWKSIPVQKDREMQTQREANTALPLWHIWVSEIFPLLAAYCMPAPPTLGLELIERSHYWMKLTLLVFSLHRQAYLLLNQKKFLYGQFSLFLPLLRLLLLLPFLLSSPLAFLSFFLSLSISLPDFQQKRLYFGSTFLSNSYRFSWSLLLICDIKVVTNQCICFISNPIQKINGENKRTEIMSGISKKVLYD